MFLAHTFIHDHHQASLSSLGGSFFIDDPFLHPYCLCADLDCLLDNRHYFLGAAENVHDLHRLWYGAKVGIAGPAQYLLSTGVNRDYIIALLSKIAGNLVAGTLRIGGEPDHGDISVFRSEE